eukprot:gene4818-8404_t
MCSTNKEIFDTEEEKEIQALRQLKKWSDLFRFVENKTSLLCKVYKAESLLKMNFQQEGEKILKSLIKKDINKTNNSKEIFLIAKCYDLLEDPKQIIWYEKASQLGEYVAQHNLAICYENGCFVPQNYDLAFKWYERAANRGHAKSINNLALCYERGLGTEQSFTKAFSYYLKSAELGNLIAQENVAICYENGDGTTQNLEKAFYWYLQSAKGGSSQGMFFLGMAYSFGSGVKKNEKEAFYWYKKSSENHSIGGTCELGNCYEFGIGTEINLDKAYECYSLISNEKVEDLFTKSSIEKAKERYEYFRKNSITFLSHIESRGMYLKLIPTQNSCLNDVLIFCSNE